MRQRIRKIAVIWFVVALFLSTVHISGKTAAAASAIPDGTYSVNFFYYEDGKDSVSMAQEYLKANASVRGQLVVEGEHATFQHEVAASLAGNFAYLGYKKPDSPKAQINKSGAEDYVSDADLAGYVDLNVSAVDSASNKVTLTYELATSNLAAKQNVLMHVYALGGSYDHWYHADLKLDVSDLVNDDEEEEPGVEYPETPLKSKQEFEELLAKAKTALAGAVEGEDYGQYKAGSITPFSLAIQYVEAAVPADENDKEAYGNLFTTLNKAITDFEKNRKLADRSEITQFVNMLNTFMEKVNRGGTTEGKPGGDGVSTAAVVGEYYTSSVNSFVNAIANAQQLINNPAATDQQIQTRIQALNYEYKNLLNSEYVQVDPLEIYVLDTREYTTEQSVYAEEVDPIANIIVQKQNESTYAGFFANLKLNVTDIVNDLVTTSVGTQESGDLYIIPPNPYVTIKAPLVTTLSTDEQKVFQHLYPFYYDNINSTNWLGHTYISYTRESDDQTRNLYISFNVKQLKQLQKAVAQAENLLEKAETDNSEAFEAFEAVIEATKQVSSNLAATRPAIQAAEAELANAAAEFKKHATYEEYFTVINSTENTVSRADSYLEKPATISSDANDNIKVTLDINNSSTIKEFKVKVDDAYVDAEVLSTNEADNKRTVAFTLPELMQWVDAQIQAVTTVNGTPYDNTYAVRLNINGVNNIQLSAKILEASALYSAAVVGNAVGQYTQAVKDQFATAIAEANQTIVAQNFSQSASDEQVSKLTEAIAQFKAAANTSGSNPGDPVYPADGSYYIPFTIYKQGTTQNSVAHGYVVPTALVEVSGATKTVTFKVKQSAEITGLMLNGSSGSVLSTDTANNKRVVSFTLSDLSSTLGGWVKVDWSELSYHHEYDIQFKFHESQAIYAGVNPSVPDDYVNPGPPALPMPGSDTENDDEKEEETSEEATETEPTDNGQESGAEVKFADTATHWAKASIEKAVKLGIVNGYADGSFRPNATVTRSEFAVMISRALKLEGEGDTAGINDFAGIPNWAKEHVARVISQGIIQGYADATFRANEQLSRAQLAVMITRAAGLQVDANATLAFADAKQIPVWAQKEVAAAVKAGLILGKENNRFDANGTATRAEALTLIVRLLEQVNL